LLFKLELLGEGTVDVESLPSYLYRVAYEHGFSVGEIVKGLCRHAIKNDLIDNVGAIPKSFSPGELVRGGNISKTIRRLLEHYTHIDLSASYLWILEKSIGESNGEVCRGFRWCPECFHEMDRLDLDPYFKLIWSMKSVTACPIHRSPFLDECSSCGQSQNTYTRNYPLSKCQSCGEPLWKRKARLCVSDIAYSWENIGVDIVELFRQMSGTDPNSIENNGAYLSLKMLFDYHWEQDVSEYLYRTIGRDRVLALIFKQRNMNLLSARRIAFRLGIPLYDFLIGRAKDVTLTLDHESFCTLPPGYLEVTKKTKRDHRLILKKIKQFVDSCTHPPTLPEVAIAVGVSKGYLEYRHGALVTKLVEKRRVFEAEQRIKNEYLATREALAFLLGEAYVPNTCSKREAFRILRQKTGLSKKLIYLGIDRASNILGI
tara:strand:- start:349 stop:1638 length:1290 start_codon:yes stop_codon:yes gene_type:complete